MDFAFNEEQEEFRSSLRRFLSERAPLEKVRQWVDSDLGYDEAVWGQLSEQLGLPSLHIPEEYGGAGYSLLEAAVAMEELGRALTPVPYFASAAASYAVLLLGTEQQKKELLPGIASGETVGTLALSEPGQRSGSVTARAHSKGSDVVLTGTKTAVMAGHRADLLVVAALREGAGSPQDMGLFLVQGDAEGVTRTRVEALDLTRPMATVQLDGAVATPLGDGSGDLAAVGRLLDTGRAMLACEMVGGTEQCLQMSVEYAKDRLQFNRPIGSFQAIKHKCADMAVELDAARSAAYFAAFAAAESSDELAVAAPLAKAQAGDAFSFAASASIQIHGGIGFTWEHDAHLYFRRAQSDALLLGSSKENREALAVRAGL